MNSIAKQSEIKNRHIFNVARSIMLQMNVSYKYWSEAVACTCHLINRTPSVNLGGKNPLEIVTSKKTNLRYLRIFGCTCYVHIQEKQRIKFQARDEICIFLSYPHRKKGYKCYSPVNKKFYISRDVKFLEAIFFSK